MAVLGVIMGVRLYLDYGQYEDSPATGAGDHQYRIRIVTRAREERIQCIASDADVVKSVRKLNMDISLTRPDYADEVRDAVSRDCKPD